MLQYTLFLWLVPAALILALTVLLLPLFRPQIRIPRLPRLFLIIEILYLIGNTAELISSTPEATFFFAKINYLFIVTAPVLWFIFAGSYTGYIPYSKKTAVLLFIIPILTVIIVFTNEIHQLFWTEITYLFVFDTMMQMKVLSYGPFFYIILIYNYMLLFTGFVFFFAKFITSLRVLSPSSVFMIPGVVIPTFINLIYIFKIIPGFTKDFSCISFSVGAAFFSLAMLRPRIFSEYSDTRRELVENVPYGFLLLDYSGKILDASKTAGFILGRAIQSIIEEFASDIFPGCTLRKGVSYFSIKYKTKSSSALLEFHSFGKAHSSLSGWLVIVKDCTKPAPPLLTETSIIYHLVLYKSLSQIARETGTSVEQTALEADSVFKKYTTRRYSSFFENLQLIFI